MDRSLLQLRESRVCVQLRKQVAKELDPYIDLDILAEEFVELAAKQGEPRAIDTIVEWYPHVQFTSRQMAGRLHEVGRRVSVREFIRWGKRFLEPERYFLLRRDDPYELHWVFNPRFNPDPPGRFTIPDFDESGSRIGRCWAFFAANPDVNITLADLFDCFGERSYDHQARTLVKQYPHRGVVRVTKGVYRFVSSEFSSWRKGPKRNHLNAKP